MSRVHHDSNSSHAVVIGAGIAGLVTARVLADSYDRVTVLDRDHLPGEPVDRPGVPQGRHAHVLLAGGLDALERLLPGFADDITAQGALWLDLLWQARWVRGVRPSARGASDLSGLCVSRALLEAYLR